MAVALYELARRANFSLIHVEDSSFKNESAFLNYSIISFPHVSSVDRDMSGCLGFAAYATDKSRDSRACSATDNAVIL